MEIENNIFSKFLQHSVEIFVLQERSNIASL